MKNSGLPPIVAAASEGYTEIVSTLIDFGDNPNHASSVRKVSPVSSALFTLSHLIYCCYLLQSGGLAPLIFAAMRGYTKTMKMLLDRYANPDQRDDVSVCARQAVYIRCSVSCGVCAYAQIACTAVMRSAAEGQYESIKLLVEYGRADWTLSAMVTLS